MKSNFFTGQFKKLASASLSIMLIALVLSLAGLGMNMGLDFTGGSLLSYDVGEVYEVSVVESALAAEGVTEFMVAKSGVGESQTGLLIQTRDLGLDAEGVWAALEERLKENYPHIASTSDAVQYVSPRAGQDIIRNAFTACIIVFACMLIYIGIRFDFYSGMAAVTGLIHDVLIMCSFMVFFRGVYQVNSPFIAAALTIIGYSINSVIIVFDRIRENAKLPFFRDKPRMELVESSVRSTLSRALNTTLTTLFTLVSVYVLGVPSIREFTFPLLVGMLSGVYTSLFLSSQLWATWRNRGSFEGVLNIFRGRKARAKANIKKA
jgi:preprotein translocase subunit SecF